MNLHTSIFFRMIKLGMKSYTPTATNEIPLPSMSPGQGYKTKPVAALGPDGAVPLKDEDTPLRPPLFKMILQLNNKLNPIKDSALDWSSREDGKNYLQTKFGPYVPDSRVHWNGHDPSGDSALVWWATAGFGALELQRLDEQTAQSERVGESVPSFVSSYEFLKDLAVRPGLASYGGAVYLDQKGEILKIKLRGRDVLPSEEKDWEAAKFAYRSSSIFWVTIYHHLFYTHCIVSNNGVLATVRNLPADNPLRRLMKPFLFRSAAINNGATDALLPQGSILHRASGLTKESLQQAFLIMQQMHTFQPFTQTLHERGLDSASLVGFPDDIFPYGRDGELYLKTLNTFSEDVLVNSPAFKNITRDDKVRTWWEQMNTGFKHSGRDLSEESLVQFLSQFFFTVTAFHSWVGHVTPYVEDPAIVAIKLFPEAVQASRQNSEEMSVITAATGLPTPELMGDFSHLMPDSYSQGSLNRLHENLRAMSGEIETRNSHRKIPFNAYLPDELNLSVSI